MFDERSSAKRDAGEGDAAHRAAPTDTDIIALIRRLIGEDGPVLALMALLSIIALGPSVFSHVLAGDDWPHAVQRGFNIDIALGSGRWLHAATILFLGADLVAPPITLSLMLVLWWAGLLAVGREAGLDRSARFVLLALFTFNPILTGFLGFETNAIAGGLSVLLCLLAGCATMRVVAGGGVGGGGEVVGGGAPEMLRRVDVGRIALPAALLAVGAAGFQQFAVLMPMAAAVICAARLARGGTITFDGMARLAVVVGITFLLGVLLYALLTSLIMALTGSATLGSQYSLVSNYPVMEYQLVAGMRLFASAMFQFLFLPQTAIPLIAKLLVLALIALIVLASLRQIRVGRPLGGLMVMALIGVLLVSPWLLGFLRIGGLYYYRALAPLALTWAGIAVIALAAWPRQPGRNGAMIAAGWLILVSVLNQNAAIFVQIQNNRRDIAIAASMVERIERLPRFAEIARRGEAPLVVIGALALREGKHLNLPEARPPLDDADFCGLFTCGHQDLAAALRALGTQDVVYRHTQPEEIGPSTAPLATKTLRGMAPWPSDDAVRMLESGEILIYLGKP